MTKIMNAKDILRQKGYVQNKFDTNAFVQVVADMFQQLPVEGSVLLFTIRFVEKIFPLTEKENSQGFYYLDAAYKSIQQHYEEMKALCEKLDEECKIADERLEKCQEEIIGKINKQLDLLQKRLRDEFKEIYSKDGRRSFDAYMRKYIKEASDDCVCPSDYVAPLSHTLINHIPTSFDLNPALTYLMMSKYKTAGKLLDRLAKRYNDFVINEKNCVKIHDECRAFYDNNKRFLELSENTIYIDAPFLKNAAGLLKTMCGFVVERHVRKGETYYKVKLV